MPYVHCDMCCSDRSDVVGGVLTGVLAAVTTLSTEIVYSKACPKATGLAQCAGAPACTVNNTKVLTASAVLPGTVPTAQSKALHAKSAAVRPRCGFA